MKKSIICYVFLLIFFATNCWSKEPELGFRYADLLFSSDFTVPYKKTGKEAEADSTFGGKISFTNFDGKFYADLSDVVLKTSMQEELWKNLSSAINEARYGTQVRLLPSPFALSFYMGQNSFSKTISRLKNPSPSFSVNALKKSFEFSSGIEVSLPSSSSSRQPQSAAFSISVPLELVLSEKEDKNAHTEKNTFDGRRELRFQGFVSEDRTRGVAFQTKKFFSPYVSAEGGITVAGFYIENDSAILEKNYCVFDSETLCAAAFDMAFKSPFVKLNFYSGFHQSPYDSVVFWFKTESRLIWKSFLLDFTYFATPTSKNEPKAVPIIGGSSAISRTLEQWNVNPQLIFSLNDSGSSIFRTGISLVNAWKITATNTPEEIQVAKIQASGSYESKFSTIQLDFTASNLLLQGTPPTVSSTPEKYYGAKLSGSTMSEKFRISTSADYKSYAVLSSEAAKKEEINIRTAISPGKTKILSFSQSLSCVFKNRTLHSGNAGANITVKFKSKRIKTTVKADFSIPF